MLPQPTARRPPCGRVRPPTRARARGSALVPGLPVAAVHGFVVEGQQHERELGSGVGCRYPPGLAGRLAVVHRVYHHGCAEGEVPLGHDPGCLVGRHPSLPGSWETSAEKRALNRVDGQLDSPNRAASAAATADFPVPGSPEMTISTRSPCRAQGAVHQPDMARRWTAKAPEHWGNGPMSSPCEENPPQRCYATRSRVTR